MSVQSCGAIAITETFALACVALLALSLLQMDNAAFGKRFKAARKAMGCEPIEFAELAKITRNYLYQIERGEKATSVDVLRRCARLMGVSADWLLGLSKQGGPKRR